jgi:RimJ/RimL family protein N-acetyltransferase
MRKRVIIRQLPVIKTDRLVLRAIRADDAASLHIALSDQAVMRWWSRGPHTDLLESQAYVAMNARQENGYHCWAITAQDDVALGWVILIEKRPGVQELGYILRRDYWGRGFAIEATAAITDYAFDVLNARRIFADVDPDNAASIALLKRLQFVAEGRLREEWETHIGVRDSVVFGLLRRDRNGDLSG